MRVLSPRNEQTVHPASRQRKHGVLVWLFAAWILPLLVAGSACAGPNQTGNKSGEAAESPDAGKRFAPPALAVVNMRKVLSGCEQWKNSRETIKKMQRKAESTLEKMKRHIQQLKTDYENLPSGTQRRKTKGGELRKAMRKYRQTGGTFEKKMTQKRAEALSEIVRAINAVVAEYADEHGIDLVLKTGRVDRASDGSADGARAIVRRAATADVLYASDQYDISRDIIERLNARHAGAISDPPTR